MTVKSVAEEYAGGFAPAYALTQTTVEKHDYGSPDPSIVPDTVLVFNDRWFDTNYSGVTPPDPPDVYVPRTVPAYHTYFPTLGVDTGIVTNRVNLTKVNFPGSANFTPGAGAIYTSCEIFGDIKMLNDNVKFYDCLLRGRNTFSAPTPLSGDDNAIVNGASPGYARGWVFTDSTVMPQCPQYLRNAFIGCGFKLERVASIWTNDFVGAYQTKATSADGSTVLNGNVEVVGCACDYTVYWHGSVSQYGPNASLGIPAQSTAAISVKIPGDDFSYTTTVSVQNYGSIKPDGTHNDCIHFQGIRGPSKTGWVHGNTLNNSLAMQLVPVGQSNAALHPFGWDDPWPQLGSLDSTGSADCHKRYQYISGQSSAPDAIINYSIPPVPNPAPSGKYTSSGQVCIATQVPSTQIYNLPDTLVFEYNFLDHGNYALNFQAGASPATEQFTFRNNAIGQNIYNASTSAPTGKAWYICRGDSKSRLIVAGLGTNYYAVPSYTHIAGWTITEGTAGSGNGIFYDGA